MIAIEPIGCYFDTDANGYLLNPCSWANMDSVWQEAIHWMAAEIRSYLGESLHSLWLRGSMPRGFYREGISDIDLFVLRFDIQARWEALSFATTLKEKVHQQFGLSANIELMQSAFRKDLATAYPQLAMIIKVQSLCLLGQNIQPDLPKYMPGKNWAIHFRWLEADLRTFEEQTVLRSEDIRTICKILLRCGFELVMEREMKYTNDLYICYVAFSKYYPEQAPPMKWVLFWYLNPDSPEEKKAPILHLGRWLLEQQK